MTPRLDEIRKMLIEHERLCMEDLISAFKAPDPARAIEPVTRRILANRDAILARIADISLTPEEAAFVIGPPDTTAKLVARDQVLARLRRIAAASPLLSSDGAAQGGANE